MKWDKYYSVRGFTGNPARDNIQTDYEMISVDCEVPSQVDEGGRRAQTSGIPSPEGASALPGPVSPTADVSVQESKAIFGWLLALAALIALGFFVAIKRSKNSKP